MSAKVGEIWANPDGVQYLVTGLDAGADSVCIGGNWVARDLQAAGWVRVATGPEDLQTVALDLTARVVALEPP